MANARNGICPVGIETRQYCNLKPEQRPFLSGCTEYTTLGCVFPYLDMVWRFRCDDPHFGDFESD